MTLTDTNLRYLLAIYHLAKTMPEVTPLAVAQAMGVTKPSVTSILSCLMKHDVIVRKRYGKVYLTARYYDDLLQKILQHFPLEGDFTTEEKEDAALAMAAALPAREVDARCAVLYGE